MAGLIVGLAIAVPSTPASAGKKLKVEIDSRPSGAQIYVDDLQSDPIGVTPLRDKKLAPGVYTLIFKKDGYETEYEQVRVKKGRTKIVVDLDRITAASIEVLADKSLARRLTGARVLVDGKYQGELPLNAELSPGSHLVEVTKEGFEPFEQWIELDKGMRETVVAEMRPVRGGGGDDGDDDDPPRRRRVARADKPRPMAAGTRVTASTRTKVEPAPENGRAPMFVIGAGLELGGRYFRYQNPSGDLRDYDSLGVPRGRVLGVLYPFAVLDTPALEGLGFTGSYGRAAPLTSFTRDGQPLDTIWFDFDVGLRYQYRTPPFTLGGEIAYGGQSYTFKENNDLFDQVPVVDYRFIRFGADVAARAHQYLSLGLGGGFLLVNSLGGEMEGRFSESSAYGVQVKVSVIGHIIEGFEARLEGNGSLYGHSYVPLEAMEQAADGGRDLIGTIFIGGAYVY